MVRASDKNDTENVKKALMIINPDAYYWGLINDEDALKEIFKRSNIRMAGNVCNQMKKEALFRPKPSPELVQELQMLDEGNVAAFEGRDIATFDLAIMRTLPRLKEGANKWGNSSRLTQSFHFFMFEPIFSPVNALNQPI